MPTPIRHPWLSLAQGIVMCSAWSATLAQQPRSPQMPAPPPMKFVSREERSQLNDAKDSKSRISITLELAADHLSKAEEFTAQKKFEQSCEELGRYLGLLADARTFLATMDPSRNSTRDLYKRFDIALRRLPPRLAVMRRSTPAEYAGNLKSAEDYTRDTRSEILDKFYGHTVLREDLNGGKKPDEGKAQPEVTKHP
jgi:hypothetical protein